MPDPDVQLVQDLMDALLKHKDHPEQLCTASRDLIREVTRLLNNHANIIMLEHELSEWQERAWRAVRK